MDQAVIDYIKKNLQAGHNLETIKTKLIEAGHSRATIEQAVAQATGQSAQIETVPAPRTSEPPEAEFGFFQKIGLALSDPNKLFRHTRHEGIWRPLKYITLLLLLVIAVNFTLILTTLFLITPGTFQINGLEMLLGHLTGLLAILLILLIFLLALIVMIVGGFAMAGVYHLFVMLLGGRAGYAGTYKALAYGTTPGLVLSFIPILNLAGMLWNLALMILGVASYHSISKGRAAAAILIPLVAAVGLYILLMYFMLLPQY